MSAASEAVAAARCFTLKCFTHSVSHWRPGSVWALTSADPQTLPRSANRGFSWQVLATDLAEAVYSTGSLERAELCWHGVESDTSFNLKMKSHLSLCFMSKCLQGVGSTKAVSTFLIYACCLLINQLTWLTQWHIKCFEVALRMDSGLIMGLRLEKRKFNCWGQPAVGCFFWFYCKHLGDKWSSLQEHSHGLFRSFPEWKGNLNHIWLRSTKLLVRLETKMKTTSKSFRKSVKEIIFILWWSERISQDILKN